MQSPKIKLVLAIFVGAASAVTIAGKDALAVEKYGKGSWTCYCQEEGKSCVTITDGGDLSCVPGGTGDNACSAGRCRLVIRQEDVTGGAAARRSLPALPDANIQGQ
jgi:hypothetical protein